MTATNPDLDGAPGPAAPTAAPTPARPFAWLVALAVGLVVSGTAFTVLQFRETQRHRAEFERGAATRGRVVADEVALHRSLLSTAQGLFDASDDVTDEAVASFLASLLGSRADHAVLAWVPRVDGSQLAPFVEARRLEGHPDFRVRRWAGGAGWQETPERFEHAPVASTASSCAASLGRHSPDSELLGWDLSADPALATVLAEARDLGEARAAAITSSPPIGALPLTTGAAAAVVEPVYARKLARSTADERRAAIRGWVVALLDPSLLVEHAVAATAPLGVDVYVFDVTPPRDATLLGFAPNRLEPPDGRAPTRGHAALVAGLHHSTDLAVGGRTWQVLCVPGGPFLEARAFWLPWTALFVALVLTALLTQTLRAASVRERAVRRAVAERTAALSVAVEDLRRENADRRRAEASLADQSDRLAITLRSLGDGVVTVDTQGRVAYLNRAAEMMTGWERDTARGRPFLDVLRLVDERSREARNEVALEALSTDAAGETSEPLLLLAVDGSERIVTIKWGPLRDRAGKALGVLLVLRDITGARRAEQAVREREELFRVLSAEMPDALLLLDFDDPKVKGRIVHANEAAARMHGSSVAGLLGRSILDLSDEATAAETPERLRRIDAGETLVYEGTHKRADGTPFPVELIARRITWGGRRLVLTLDRDITERRRADEERRRGEAKLQHAQRLESLGVLAGGIAHDFNNLLMGILGNAELALLQMDPKSPAGGRVEDVKRAGLRASELTQRLLAYAGKGRFVVEPLDLNDLVRDMAKLVEVSMSKRVRLRYAFSPDVPPVEADAAQIRQVVMNLLTNASEAIGDREGLVTLRTGTADVDAAWLAGAYGGTVLAPGRYVFIEVEDTGVGMDEDTQRKIFEPFFTTKFTGRGLGLAALLGIVRGHHGAVKVVSAPGRGSTFRIVLPPYRGRRPVHRTAMPADSVESNGHASGTILVVDDDASVLEVTKRMLSGAGYEVLSAPDGRRGVGVYRTDPDRIDVVLLDMTMPGMTGEETLKEIRAIRSDALVLLTSGFTEQDAMERFAGLHLSGFVQKPFERDTLLRRVASVIEERVRLG